MLSTLLESGRARCWRPVHSAFSLTAHAATAAVVFTFGDGRPLGGSADTSERTTYTPLRFVEPVTSAASPERRAGSGPAAVRVLRAPHSVPVGLPPVPAVDLAVLTVLTVAAIPSDELDPTRFAPSSGELLAGAADGTAMRVTRGHAERDELR